MLERLMNIQSRTAIVTEAAVMEESIVRIFQSVQRRKAAMCADRSGHSGVHGGGKGKAKACADGSGEDDDNDLDSQASGSSATFCEGWRIEARMARQRTSGR